MPVPFVTLRYHAQEICRTLVCRLNALIKTLEDGGGATGNLWRYVVGTLGSNDLGLSSDNETARPHNTVRQIILHAVTQR